MNFEADLQRCVPSLRSYARGLLRDADAADDLVQDCLERALGRRHLWRGGQTLRPWLYRIMYNLFLNQIRHRRAYPLPESLPADRDMAGPEDTQGTHMALREMERALNTLPSEQRDVVLLVALSGLSYQERATILDVPIGTIMSRLARGRERLRTLLEAEVRPLLQRVK